MYNFFHLATTSQVLDMYACIRIYLYLYRRVCVCLSVCVSFWAYIHVAACGPIGTKFGTRMEIHLEMVMGEIKITPCDLGGIWGGFRGKKITNLE